MLANPPERFSGRVESYRRYRPRYPAEIVDVLIRECGLSQNAAVVDVAAGTGLLSEIFLAAGFDVTAIEPNAEMRAACVELRQSYPKLQCIPGTAEETGLPSRSADGITVAQAMHWFDLERTGAEFRRVLKPGGWCAVIYNHRRMGGDAFHDAYEELLRKFGVDYVSVQQQHVGHERLAEYFTPGEMKRRTFSNSQKLTREGFEGRIVSSSYVPRPGQVRFGEMRANIERIFDTHQSGGSVTLEYECEMCYGQLG